MNKTIFDYINAVLYSKDKSVYYSVDDDAIFSSFMLNRWLSMYSPEVAITVNETTNKYQQVFQNKKQLFDFYVTIYPKLKSKKIPYIKKSKEDKTKEDLDKIRLIASSKELSQREVMQMMDLIPIVNKQ